MNGAAGGEPRPPRLAELLLRGVISDPEAREGILGDLWEEYLEAARRSSAEAALRYWWCALRIASRYALWPRPRRRDPAPGPGVVAAITTGRSVRDLFEDLAYAGRSLGRRPRFSLAITLFLGLGLGASATIFSVLNAVVLRPIPFPDADRLVRFSQINPSGMDFAVSQPDFLDFRERALGMMEMAALMEDEVTLVTPRGGERVTAFRTTSDLFRIFGGTPALGRLFAPDEEAPGGDAPVALLSHTFWAQRFGGDPKLVGGTVRLARGAVTVVGVLPEGFVTPLPADLWLPGAPSAFAPREDHRLAVYGRLAPGVSIEQARQELRGIAEQLALNHPGTNRGWGARLMPLRDWVVGPDVRLITLTLVSAVGLLLLLISANVSNLLMARTTTRQQEVGIRSAIGAGRARVVRQVVAESLLLGAAGGGAGLLLAYLLAPVVARQPEIVPRLGEVAVDGSVVAFTAVVSAAVALAIGLGPAFLATRWRTHDALTETGDAAVRSARRIQDALVVGEVALAMALLVGAGLLGRSFVQLQRVDKGFDTDGLLMAEVRMSARHGPEETRAAYREVLMRLREVEGVRSAAGTSMRYFDLAPRFFAELGRVDSPPEEYVTADWRVITDDYLETAGLALLAGRTFVGGGEGEVLVSRALAEDLWADSDPIGRGLRWDSPAGEVTTVVGVVTDVADVHPALPGTPSAYVAHGHRPVRAMTLLVRVDRVASDLGESVRGAVHGVDRQATVSDLWPATERYAAVLALDRFLTTFLALVAGVAVTLAALGIYGLFSFTVARKTREIGVRIALGGHPGAIVGMLFRHGLRLVLVGIVLGSTVAVGLARVVSTVLFRTRPTDPSTYMAVGLLLATVSLLATYVPARRATRVDPRRTLSA